MTTKNQAGSISASESEINVRMAGQKNLVIVGATGMVGGTRFGTPLSTPRLDVRRLSGAKRSVSRIPS
jgi:hypothetical protein